MNIQGKLMIVMLPTAFLLGCENLQSLEKKQLTYLNPTEHVFNLPLDTLKKRILEIFEHADFYQSSFYQSSIFFHPVKDHQLLVTFTAESFNDALFGEKHFKNPNTSNDIYLHSFGFTWNSPLYYAGGKPLEFRTAFILSLKPIDQKRTLLKIKPENPKVLKGIDGIGPHGFIAKEIAVDATTIEEYTLMLFIAEQLGDSTLQPLNMQMR